MFQVLQQQNVQSKSVKTCRRREKLIAENAREYALSLELCLDFLKSLELDHTFSVLRTEANCSDSVRERVTMQKPSSSHFFRLGYKGQQCGELQTTSFAGVQAAFNSRKLRETGVIRPYEDILDSSSKEPARCTGG